MSNAYTTACIIGRCTRTADYGRHTCHQCAEAMRAQLAELEDYAAALDPRPGKGGDGGRQAPGFGSRSPARDDVLAALDPRSLPYVLGPDDEDHAPRPILETLHHLAQWIAEEADDLRANHHPTITREARYLRSRIDWCTGQPWVDELAEDLRDLHGQCRRLAGDPPPVPVAYCECSGPLWKQHETKAVALRCGECGATYDGFDLLGIAQEHAA